MGDLCSSCGSQDHQVCPPRQPLSATICPRCYVTLGPAHEYPECPGSAPAGYVTVNLLDLLTVLSYVPKSGTPIPDNALERVEWNARRKLDMDAKTPEGQAIAAFLKAATNARGGSDG